MWKKDFKVITEKQYSTTKLWWILLKSSNPPYFPFPSLPPSNHLHNRISLIITIITCCQLHRIHIGPSNAASASTKTSFTFAEHDQVSGQLQCTWNVWRNGIIDVGEDFAQRELSARYFGRDIGGRWWRIAKGFEVLSATTIVVGVERHQP